MWANPATKTEGEHAWGVDVDGEKRTQMSEHSPSE